MSNKKELERVEVDWKKTGKILSDLRRWDPNLRRYACEKLNARRHKNGEEACDGTLCDKCQSYNMEAIVSQEELGHIFEVSKSVIVNWESGRTQPRIEDLLYYEKISKKELKELLVIIK